MKVILMTAEEVESLVRRVASETLAVFREEIALEDGKPRDAGGEFVDKRGAAKILKCSTGKVDMLAREGRLKKSFVGRSVRFLRADVLAIFDRKKAK
jgi:excisionase family DNA binding protein